MKKYLMTGIAALAMCFGFTSCSHELDNLSQEEIDQMKANEIAENYKKAFVTQFGQPAADQDWGFGTTVTRADGEFANHVGAYPDANMWTSKGFLAPDPLTHAQKLRAQYYFQMNKITNPNRPDYGQIDFFMQQVYDGGTDPMAGKSPEVYPAADGNTMINSGEHMDHLTCGPDHTHTYNFNNGTCSTNANVANRDQTDVNNTAQQHSDEIQLMLNTKTSCFGYANSDASCVRDDRWTLVSATTIDNFCDNDPNFASWLVSKLNAGEVDKKCDDEFHRSFIGFDFDQLPDNLVYAGTEVWEYGKPEYNYQPHLVSKTYENYHYYRYDLYGAKYHYLKAEQNQYCGQFQNIDPEPNEAAAKDLLDAGWLPVENSANKKWVKVGGCNDGYYSDWIVTFKPATSGTVPPPSDEYTIRVIAEDLTFGTDLDTDFDFNDVVFDVCLKTTETKIRLKAAGGTLPLIIGIPNPQNDQDYLANEVHEIFGVQVNVMVNTNAHLKGLNSANKEDKFLTLNTTYTNAKDIPVHVKKNGTWVQLTAVQGEPASKIGVDINFQWVNERESMKGNYPLFVDWVQADAEFRSQIKWW